MRDSMSQSEESFNILEWPLLMPVIFGIFLTECVVGGWGWTVLPEWRWLVYLIIAIDLLTLVVIYIMVVRAKASHVVTNNDSEPLDESQ